MWILTSTHEYCHVNTNFYTWILCHVNNNFYTWILCHVNNNFYTSGRHDSGLYSITSRGNFVHVIPTVILSSSIFQTNSSHAIYSNSLFIYQVHNVSFTQPVSIPFSCAYPLDTESSLDVAVAPYLPWVETPHYRKQYERHTTSKHTTTHHCSPAPSVSLPDWSRIITTVSQISGNIYRRMFF
jgi:hypothetical protein